MKAFISQPMGGVTDKQINARREEITKTLRNVWGDDLEILDTNFNLPGKSALYYLAESIKVLDEANIAYFAKGWENYNGCVVEHLCCKLYDIPIFYEN